jgi:hypothetical protein
MFRPLDALTVLLLGAAPAAAQPLGGPGVEHMHYAGSALGVGVMALDADVAMDRTGYHVDIGFRTTGLLSLFVRSDIYSTVQGTWRADRPVPQRFESWGELRGVPRQTLIDYEQGDPILRRLEPPNTSEREEVPAAERTGTIDTLSALAFLVHQVAVDGTCDGRARVFDGRRLSDITARTVGPVGPVAGQANWPGGTLRCDFEGQQLAGFMLDDSSWARRPHTGVAWLAHVVPGGPLLPVRLTFETRWVSDVTLVLTSAGPGPAPQLQAEQQP